MAAPEFGDVDDKEDDEEEQEEEGGGNDGENEDEDDGGVKQNKVSPGQFFLYSLQHNSL